jgi:MFS family permease
LADRLGVFLSFIIGILLFSLSLVLFMFAWNFWMFTAFLLLSGVGGILSPIIHSWLGEVSETHRGLNIGITSAFYSVGGFLGSWLTGSLIKEGYPWVLPFHIFALLGFTSAVACFLFRGCLKPQEDTSSKGAQRGLGYGLLLRSKALIIVFFGMLLSNMAYVNFIVWAPSFLIRLQGFNIAEGGVALALFSLIGSGGAVGSGYLYGRVKRQFLTSALGFASALSILPIILLNYSVATAFLLFSFFGLLFSPYWNLQITMAQESVDKAAVGRATGLVQSAGVLSSVIGPFLLGIITDHAGIVAAFLCTIFLPIITYGVIILAWKPRRGL